MVLEPCLSPLVRLDSEEGDTTLTRIGHTLGLAVLLALTSMILEPVLVLSEGQDQAQGEV